MLRYYLKLTSCITSVPYFVAFSHVFSIDFADETCADNARTLQVVRTLVNNICVI